MSHYQIELKADSGYNVAFAQGEKGEILYISHFPGKEMEISMGKYVEMQKRILDDDHHLKFPDEYITIKHVNQSEAQMMFGLPEITPLVAASHDLRQGIKIVSEKAMKEIKG